MPKKTKKEIISTKSKDKNTYALCPMPKINIMPKFLEEERHYDTEHITNIKLPLSLMAIGKARSGKTYSVFSILKAMEFPFDRYVLIVKDPGEPIYQQLQYCINQSKEDDEEEAEDKLLQVSTSLADLPDINAFDRKINNLVLIDDQTNASDKLLQKLCDYYTMGAKHNVSVIYIGHMYFEKGKESLKKIKQNSMYFLFQKIPLLKLKAICKDLSENYTPEEMVNFYVKIRKENEYNFMLVDCKTTDEKLKLRKNLG